MFKGTKNYGTMDLKRDLALQQQIEAAYQVVLSEEGKRNPDRALIQAKRKEMEQLRLEVAENLCAPGLLLPAGEEWGCACECVHQQG